MTNPRATIGDNQPPALDVILKDRYADLEKRRKAWNKKAADADLSPKTEADIQALEKLFVDGDKIAKDAEAARVVEKDEPLKAGKIIDAFFNQGFRDTINALANPIKNAALKRRAEITAEEQRKAKEEADRKAKQAADDQAKADAAAARGDHRMAEVHDRRADAKMNEAAAAQATASQDLRTASRSSAGGITSAVGMKDVCTGIVKAELDLEALRPFLKEADLIAAVNTALKMGNPKPKGAIVEQQIVGSIRGR